MLDHPYISDPNYTTTLLAWTYGQNWYDGSFLFFESMKVDQNGFVILDVYYAAYGFGRYLRSVHVHGHQRYRA